MFELELDSLRSTAGRLKAELSSFNLARKDIDEALGLIDQAIGKIETAVLTRTEDLATKPNQPRLDGTRGVEGDDLDEHEEVEEEVEEDEVDESGKVVGKKTVKKTVTKPKAKIRK